MHHRTYDNFTGSSSRSVNCSNAPIECIRKTRCLNINKSSSRVSREIYKILKSNNGRKIFT